MEWKTYPLPDGSYSDDTRPWSAQDVVNYIPVFAEAKGARSPVQLRDLPGLVHVKTIGEGPIRGSANVQGKRFIVSGDKAYWWKNDNSALELGALPGTGRVEIVANQFPGGQHVMFLGASPRVYNTQTGAFAAITDEGFPGAIAGDYIDTMGVFVEPGRRFAFNSALTDLTAYNTLERFEGETSPDLIKTLRVCHNEIYLFNETTIEPFRSTGVTNRLFQNTKNTIERGCASSYGVCNLDNTLQFIADDDGWYKLNGYVPQRLSTHPIEQELARCDLSKAFMMTWEDRGHKVAYLTCPDGHTWGYDVATGRFHRRQSYDMNRWRLNTLFKWKGDYYGGEFNSGRIFRLDWDYMMEGDDPHIRSFSPPVIHNNGNRLTLVGVKFEVDTGGPVSVYTEIADYLTVTGDLPDGTAGDVVSYRYTAIGGDHPLSFAVSDGSLPPGLSMAGNGHVTGTLTTPGSYAWTVEVTDAESRTATVDDTCLVAAGTVVWGYTTDGFSTFVAFNTLLQAVGYTSPATLPSGSSFALCLNEDKSVLFGAGTGAKMVRVDTVTRTFISASVGDNNQCVACNADGTFAYTADADTGDVFKRNGTTLASVAVAAAGIGTPRAICLSRDGATLYAVGAAGAIKRFQTSDMSPLSDFAVPGQYGICVNHAGNKLYLSNSSADEVKVVNQSSGSLLATITLAALASPRGICVSADDSTVWVANNGTNTVNRIRTSDNTVIATIACSGADQVSLSADGLYLYVNTSAASITVISTVSNTVTGTIACGIGSLLGLAVSPA